MQKKCGIYCIKNIINNKMYIGQTTGIFATRKNNHFYHLKKSTHRNGHLQKSFNKYGEKCFTFIVLEVIPENLLDERERFFIQYYKTHVDQNGYNMETGGHDLKHLAKETREKISKSRKGIKFSPETCMRMSLALKGKKLNLSPEQLKARKTQLKEALNKRTKESYGHNKGHAWSVRAIESRKKYLDGTPRMPWKGKPLSEEHKQKIRLAQIGKLRTITPAMEKAFQAKRGIPQSEEAKIKNRKSQIQRYTNPQAREATRQAMLKHFQNPQAHEVARQALFLRWRNHKLNQSLQLELAL